MKKFVFALVIALLAIAQVISPVAAASPQHHAIDCGDTYIVRWGDTLSKIAAKCGTTVSDILARNPFIHNASLIYAGQSLRLTGDPVEIPETGGGTYVVRRGDTLAKIAARFGTNTWTLMRLNPFIWNANVIYAGWTLNLPGDGDDYEPWDPGYPPYTPPSRGVTVTVSKTRVEAGGTFKVSVTGFPKNANIDYRIGEVGEDYTAVVDDVTDENGRASATLTMPDEADEGEYWVVRVVTTELKKGAEITTPRIRIID